MIAWFVPGGQWTKSHRRIVRSSPLDDEKRFIREHDEVFLSGFPVVHRHRLARLEKSEVDPELPEPWLALEIAQRATTSPQLPPFRIARIENEPTIALRHKAAIRLDKLRLNDHSRRACHLRHRSRLGEGAHARRPPPYAREM
jgi:hypothetical protein